MKKTLYITQETQDRLAKLGGPTPSENLRRAVALAECADELANALDAALWHIEEPTGEFNDSAAEEILARYKERQAMSIKSIEQKFTSANSVPVDRAMVTRDEWEAALSENEALRVERDELAAHAERLKNHMLGLQQSSDGVSGLHLNGDLATWDELMEGGRFEEWLLPFTETPSQSLAHIRAAGAREALERATQPPGFSGTVVRVDVMREIIEQMEAGE